MKDRNSMMYWWPKVKDLNVPQARTIVVPIKAYMRVVKALDGRKSEAFDHLVDAVDKACNDLRYPAFIRTDHMSSKHDWKDCCYVPIPEVLANHLCRLIEEHACAMLPAPKAIVVREFLELEHTFTAFHGEMPISKERRLFVNNGIIVCSHPYWPPQSIQRSSCKDWLGRLNKLNRITKDEQELLAVYAKEICKAVGGGYWSIDFCKVQDIPVSADGASDKPLWFFTDMALGVNSYHWEGCEQVRVEHLRSGKK